MLRDRNPMGTPIAASNGTAMYRGRATRAGMETIRCSASSTSQPPNWRTTNTASAIGGNVGAPPLDGCRMNKAVLPFDAGFLTLHRGGSC